MQTVHKNMKYQYCP